MWLLVGNNWGDCFVSGFNLNNFTHVLNDMAEVDAVTTADPSSVVQEIAQDEAVDDKSYSTHVDSSREFAEKPSEEKDTRADNLKQSEATDEPCNDTSVASTESAKQSGVTETPTISTLEEKIIRQIEVSKQDFYIRVNICYFYL